MLSRRLPDRLLETDLRRRRSDDFERERRGFRSRDLDLERRDDFRSLDLERDRRDDFLSLERFGDLDRDRRDFFSDLRSDDFDLERLDDFLSPDFRRLLVLLDDRDLDLDFRREFFELFFSLSELEVDRCRFPETESSCLLRLLFSFSGSTLVRSSSS